MGCCMYRYSIWVSIDDGETQGTVPGLVGESSGIVGFSTLPWSPGDISMTLPSINTCAPWDKVFGDAVIDAALWPLPKTYVYPSYASEAARYPSATAPGAIFPVIFHNRFPVVALI